MTTQFEIRQNIWKKLNELHMLIDDHVDEDNKHSMCLSLHSIHDDIDQLMTTVRLETINAQPKTDEKYTAAVGSAYNAENKVWFVMIHSHSTGCYYFGPFPNEQDAISIREKLNIALKLINALVDT